MSINPTHFYKYKKIDEYTLKALSDGKMYFASRKQFNDPIDSHPHYELDIGAQELAQLYELLTPNKGVNPVTLSIESARFELERIFDKYLDGKGIYSLSTTYDNPLMWSHYADEHKGICLGFRSENEDTSDKFYKPRLGRVEYGRSRSVLYSEILDGFRRENLRGAHAALDAALYSKAPDWWYEEEWRYIHYQSGSEYELPAELEEVIFGWRTPRHVIDIVMKIVFYDRDVDFYKMKFLDGSFEMERVEIVS